MAVVIGGLALATPFVFAGLCIGRILMEREEKISVLYGINLVGSGVGCASYPLAVRALGGPGAIVCAAAIGLAASVFFLRRRGKVFVFQSAVACALVAVGLAVSGRVLIIRTHAEKDLSTFQEKERYPDAKLEWSYWSPLCRTDILGSTRYAAVLPDGSEVPRKVVTIDGGAMTYMWGGLTEAQVEACQADYEFMYSFKMLAYLTKRNPDVLLIGVGGGSDVVNAKLHEANSIVGVDINEGVIKAMKGTYRKFTGGLYAEGLANITVAEGRNFVRHTNQRFDIIHMHGVDTYAALSSGAFLFSENYLYTVEAFEDYLDRLKEDGIFSCTRRSRYPPRETMKVFSGAVDALENLGSPDPFRHIIALANPISGLSTTILCKRSPFTPDEIARYEELCRRVPYVVYWIPGSRLTKPTLPDGRDNPYYAFSMALRQGRRQEFYRDYPYEVISTTDDRPFFYKSFRFRNIVQHYRAMVEDGRTREFWSLLVLLALAAEAFLGTVVLIFVPLLRFKRDGLRVSGAGRYSTYFCCLGVGFLLLEITLMQRLSLFLGHPGYSVSVVLFSLLVFSGLGSLCVGRLTVPSARLVRRSISALAVIALLLNFGLLSAVTRWSLAFPLPARVTIAMLLVAPLGFVMGIPFPTGLKIVKDNEAIRFIPWAWGINGAASVLGSVMSILLAMTLGFSTLTVLAVLAYIFGMIVLTGRPIVTARGLGSSGGSS